MLPVAGLEVYLSSGLLSDQLLARQHAAEDGSDRSEWEALPQVDPDLAVRSVHPTGERSLLRGGRASHENTLDAIDKALRRLPAPSPAPCGFR